MKCGGFIHLHQLQKLTGMLYTITMKKFGITSPSELKGDKEKEFYDYIDKNWKGKGEKKEEKIIRIMSEVGGKYLKYSDLLLQKSRLVDKHGPSSSQVKKVNGLLGKEMKKLGIEEVAELQGFFEGKMNK